MRDRFNQQYNKSIECGSISPSLSKMIVNIIDLKVDNDMFGNSVDIVKSDIMMFTLERIVTIMNNNKLVDNPYTYFNKVIHDNINKIYKQRFSSAKTKDRYGCSIIAGRNSDHSIRIAKFIDVDNIKDKI